MSRWEVYSFLKQQNGNVSMSGLKIRFPGIKQRELKEGIAEYDLIVEREGRFARRIT